MLKSSNRVVDVDEGNWDVGVASLDGTARNSKSRDQRRADGGCSEEQGRDANHFTFVEDVS